MIHIIDITGFEKSACSLPVLDVRSPSEYEQGHIPGSVNLPLFNDEERALVGIRYKQSGRYASVGLGLDLVGNKLSSYVKKARNLSKGNAVMMYCWRGGMRSGSMAWLLDLAGFDVYVLEGGYKSYRAHIRKQFQIPLDLIVLGGKTGTGKSAILLALLREGHQVLDLEALAHHKGSVFGGLGMTPQHTNEQFENNLYQAWQKLDTSKTVWIEDESLSIGSVSIPEPLYNQLISSPVLEISLSRPLRINRLVQEYAHFPTEVLIPCVKRISKKLGGPLTLQITQMIEEHHFEQATDLLLSYYDKAYEKSLQKRVPRHHQWRVELVGDDPATNAQLVLSTLKRRNNQSGIHG